MTPAVSNVITRVVPVNGLLVDADLWAAAHDFHRLHQQRHGVALHGYGIAQGLETVAHDPPNRTLIIYPGLAIDPIGNLILVPECERYTVQSEQPGPIHVVLQFREVAAGSRGPAGGGVPTHLREAYRIVEYRALPDEPHVELARIWLTGGREPLADATDPFTPGPNQIDLRQRVVAGTFGRGEIAIGQAWLDSMPMPIHNALPVRLTEAINASTGFRARFVGQISPREAVDRCTLLYLAGQGTVTISGDDLEGLRAFVDAGGTLVGDGCHPEAADAFSATFADLASKLGRTLRPIEAGAALLSEPFPFAGPPVGSAPGSLYQADGLVYCQADYGCALTGGRAGQPLDRSTIRAVAEFITNVAIQAHRRHRTVRFAADRRAP